MLSAKFFIDVGAIEERLIEMGDGSSEPVFFRQLPNTAFERYAIWCSSADEEIVASASARLLAMGLCEPDGTPALDLETATRIKRPVMQRLVRALLEVNGYGKAAQEKQGND